MPLGHGQRRREGHGREEDTRTEPDGDEQSAVGVTKKFAGKHLARAPSFGPRTTGHLSSVPGPRGPDPGVVMVEAGGIEPPSGRLGSQVSPCAAYACFSSRWLGVGSRPSRPARMISTAAAGRSGGPACFGVAVIRFAGGS